MIIVCCKISRLSSRVASNFQGTQGFFSQVFDVADISEKQAGSGSFSLVFLCISIHAMHNVLSCEVTLTLSESDGAMGYPGKVALADTDQCQSESQSQLSTVVDTVVDTVVLLSMFIAKLCLGMVAIIFIYVVLFASTATVNVIVVICRLW